MTTTSKFFLLTCLYFSQGLPYGFFTQALPVLMRREGASLPAIGLASLLSLPWMLKWLWAPQVDRRGRKKTWVLVLQAMAVILFASLGYVSRLGGYAFLVYGYFIANLIAATQDIASDGLAVNLLTAEERGLGNGLQVAGYRLGMIFGGGFILLILGSVGWHGAFFIMALALIAASLPVLKYQEPAVTAPSRHRPSLNLILDFVRQPGMWMWLLMIGIYKFGDAMTSQMLQPYLVDRQMTNAEIGILLGTWGFLSGLVGALLGGYLVTKIGRYRSLVLFGIIQAGGVLAYYLLNGGWLREEWLTLICAAEHFSGGMATAALFTAMMDVCSVERSATDYTIQASVVVFATAIAKLLSGIIAQYTGYSGNFLISTLLCLLGVLLFAVLYRGQRKQAGPSFSVL